MERIGWIEADWPAAAGIRAGVSTRALPGRSVGPYAQGNLGVHVGDDPAAVAHNRELLRAMLNLPAEPIWLEQVHGTAVFSVVDSTTQPHSIAADASVTRCPGVVLAVQTADCLPILLANRSGTEIAAIHAGWRGLAAGVVEETLAQMTSRAHELRAWIGPAIGPDAFEVGDDVREAMVSGHVRETAEAIERCFRPQLSKNQPVHGKWLCDLARIALLRLRALGVDTVAPSGLCSYTDQERFFSHRRDRVSGRMVSLIWMSDSHP